jgi:putative DNA primase/helicase
MLDGEMAQSDIIERKNELDLNSDILIYSDAQANREGVCKAHLSNELWRSTMKEVLISRGVKLWVVDNLASLAGGLDENAKKDWDPINSWLLELRFAGISTILLHHTGKGGDQRGTSAREDNIDCSIILKRPHDYRNEDGARFITNFSKARVPTKELELINDIEFKLTVDEHGKGIWVFGDVEEKNKVKIIKMLSEKMLQKDIASEVGVSGAYVTRIKKKAVGNNEIDSEGNLTWDGEMKYRYG